MREGRHARFDDYDKQLRQIAAAGYATLLAAGARAAVCDALKRLEDDPLFNAGTGSRLQRDGQARMSAALMDSEARRFAGVINVERVRYPSELADHRTPTPGARKTAGRQPRYRRRGSDRRQRSYLRRYVNGGHGV